MTAPTISLHRVSKRYGGLTAVAEVDLALFPAERVALVGHNGAGKSTLIKLMLGLIRPSEGWIEVFGHDPAGANFAGLRRAIGFLPENVVFPPAMTGAEVLGFYARLKRAEQSRNRALLERVGLADAADRRVGTYSKGMRQRLGLAQALIGAPRLLLLDEPTTGLDPGLRQSCYDIIDDLRRQGATVLLSSHALAEIEHEADRIIVLDHGRKVADGALADLRRRAALPTRIRIRLPAGTDLHPGMLAGRAERRRLDAETIELRCPDSGKVEVLRSLLAACPAIANIEIRAPTLDDLYADLTRRRAAE